MDFINNINSEFKSVLDSVKEEDRLGVHSFHRYYGKLIPAIPRAAIREFTNEGDVVFDPFVGSGTTAVETLYAERNFVGVEINPLSVLISNIKTANYDVKILNRLEKRILAEGIHLKIKGSEKICMIGANGAGKTTLLKKIAEELLNRNDIKAEYMPQTYEDLLDLDVTPVDYLDKTGDKEERTRIRTYLGSLKYTPDEMEHPIRELSGGQKAKVLLLRMSLSGANVLILDEPTRNFSPLSGPVIRKMLREFPGAVISISHDRKYIEEVCDKIYQLNPNGLQLIGD